MPATGSVSHTFTLFATETHKNTLHLQLHTTLCPKARIQYGETDGAAIKAKSSNQLPGIGPADGVASQQQVTNWPTDV